jgi:hypothetical protein
MSDELRDERLSRLYRESDRIEPPPALDAAILAAAREAVKPAPSRRAWWQSWTVPMSVAATVVLTVTLTLLVQQEQEPMVPEAAPAADVPRASVAIPQKNADAAADLAVKPAAPREAKQEAVKREAEGPAAAPAPAPAAAAPAGAVAPRAPIAESVESAAPTKPAVMRQQAAPAADAVESRAKSAPLRKEAVGAALARAPEQWLEDIREMKKQGKEKEAAEALAEFRKAYPDYKLPDDLR